MNISVIIPVYNAEKFLRKSVESALQFDEVKEVILIEDGSTDQSLKECQALDQQYNRVKLFQHSNAENKGAAASRNLGITKCTYEYIAFLDADDYYLSNRFDAEKKIFSENPSADGVYGALGVYFISEKVEENFYQSFSKPNDTNSSFLTSVKSLIEPNDLFKKLVGIEKSNGSFHINCLTIKSKKLKKLTYYFNDSLHIHKFLHEDTEFIIRLAYFFKLFPGIIDQPIAIRGVHENNRITKIVRTSKIYYKNRFLLYDSLYKWSKKEKIPQEYISFLNYKKQIFFIQSIFPLEKLKYLLFKITGKKNTISQLYKKVKQINSNSDKL